MYLRSLIGPRAGEVLNFSPEAARAMLEDGRAELPEAAEERVAGFATGGAVTSQPVLVGARVTGSVLPAALAAKLNDVLPTAADGAGPAHVLRTSAAVPSANPASAVVKAMRDAASKHARGKRK